MEKLRRCLVWYVMSTKRLLYKPSFLVLILLIPILAISLNSALADDGGVLKIVLCADKNNPAAMKIINNLFQSDGIINFEVLNDGREAEDAVRTFKADAAWIFASDFENKIDLYTENKTAEPAVRVVEREDTVSLKLSREVLYGAIFEDISYSVYKNFVYSDIASEEEIGEKELRTTYFGTEKGRSIVSFKRLNEGEMRETPTFLTAPVRGLLSLVIVLCALAAAMYFLSDKKEGKYDWLSKKKQLAPSFALCLSAVVLAASAVFVAIVFSSFSVRWEKELLSMVIFIIMTVGFAMFFSVAFSSPGALGATIPGIMIVMLVLSPIFFNMKVLRPLRLTLPTYYYLQSIHNSDYYFYGIFYSIVAFSVVFLINEIKNLKVKID